MQAMRDKQNMSSRNRETKTARKENGKKRNSIFLFGDFQIFNRKGEDVVQHLPPKVQELFLMIMTSSFKPFNHITIKAINSHLWPDHSPEQAKNNRSVSVNKLRSVLDEVDGIKICCDNKVWWIELEENLYCDYHRFLAVLSAKTLTLSLVQQLNQILKRGKFMKEHDYHWFENDRMKLCDGALQKLKEHLHRQNEESEIHRLIAESILHLDPLSESALRVKIHSLIKYDEHTAARATFDHFKKEYQYIYGVEYKKTFSEMLK